MAGNDVRDEPSEEEERDGALRRIGDISSVTVHRDWHPRSSM